MELVRLPLGDRPYTKPSKDRKSYELAVRFGFTFKGVTHIIPVGFKFDGASIPWFARPLIGGKYSPQFILAALIHDWLYRTNGHGVSRMESDKIFFQILIEQGVALWRANLMLTAVVLFGWVPWRRSRSSSKLEVACLSCFKACRI